MPSLLQLLRQSLILMTVVAFSSVASAVTTVVSDNYNVTTSGTGFDLNTGVNAGINPPTTRLTGTAKANLRYLNTGTKATNSYTISGNKLQVTSAPSSGRFVLSSDGIGSFDFSSVLGVTNASATNRVMYDLSITINNNSAGSQRCSFALGTSEGDATTWDFGFQVYRAGTNDDFYSIGKRIDTGSSGLTNDLNKVITTLTHNTYGNDITIRMRVTDAGSETSAFNSRVQLSINGGNSWFYDSDNDSDLPNGWRLNGAGRHIMWDIAPDAGPVTYESFSLKLNPPLSNVNTSSTFRVMTYNIHSASGPDGKVNTQRIADFITSQNVDLVSLNEVARFMARSDGRDVIGELATETGMTFVFSNNMTGLTGNDQFGNAILSRYPVLFRDHRLLPNVGGNEQRGWLKAVVDLGGKDLSFWVTHLDFHADDTERLMCGTNFNSWIADETLPVVFCGDFNDTPNTSIYNLMEKKWTDIWPDAGDGSLGRTVPCPGYPNNLNARIDYIWKADSSGLLATNAAVGYTVEGSDHYPVLTQFVFTNFNDHALGFCFPFDQGSGNRAVDIFAGLSGKLGLTNSPTWSTNSPTGASNDFSLYFDGTKMLSVIDTNQVIGTNGVNDDYTLQAWIQLPLNYSPPERAVLFQYERKPGFSISINTNRTLHTTAFKLKDVPSNATVPNDGQWHHVAVVHKDGVNMKFYIDGTLAATVNYSNGAGYRADALLTIGAASEGANWFTGYLDRVRFNQRALTPSEFDFPAAPLVGATMNQNAIAISWTAAATNYTLQSATNLAAPLWKNVPVQLVGDRYQTNVAATNAASFFRLHR